MGRGCRVGHCRRPHPPEVVASRRLSGLRRRITIALTVLAVVIAGGYTAAMRENSTAHDQTVAEQGRTAALLAQQRQYRDLTQTQAKLTLTRIQVASLMSADVDVSRLLTTVNGPLPTTMSIKTLAVNLIQATVTTGVGSAGGLDTSGRAPIGTVVIGGTAASFDDVAHYADTLARTAGVVDVVPTSSQVDDTGLQYSLTFTLTDTLLSKRFDLRTGADTP